MVESFDGKFRLSTGVVIRDSYIGLGDIPANRG